MRKVLYLLGQLSDTDVDWLVKAGRREQYKTGTILIREGQPIDALYVLLNGELHVTGNAVGAAPIVLRVGEVVGEISFVDSRPPTATVIAGVDSLVLAVPRDRLKDKLRDDPIFASGFYRAIAIFLAQRLRNLGLRFDHGKATAPDLKREEEDELGDEALDCLHLAGTRFDRVLQRLMSE